MSETITVTQLNTRVKELFNSSPGVRDVWVSGEISNLKRYPSGHYYFTLKDPGSEIRGVLFAGSRSRMDFEPLDNMKVLAYGHADMYVQRGSYQFIVETMRRSGVGDLYAEFERLKAKLEAEGLFDRSRKRPLPKYPRRIGVVTSPTGAVIHDIITTSASRFPADIILAPAQVQGEGAAVSIVSGIEMLNRYGVDIIIVGRGGGSIEDLWAFNEEPVARAIAASEVPIVSAVGHETDFTISDFVADARAPTPTGAAAIILRDRSEVSAQIDRDMARLDRAMVGVVREMRHRYQVLDARLSPKRASESLAITRMHLDEMSLRSDRALGDKVSEMRHRFQSLEQRISPSKASGDLENLVERLGALASRLDSSIDRSVEASSAELGSLSARLEALNPLNVLGRGYGMVTDSEGRVLTSVSGMGVGDKVTITMRDGSVKAAIGSKEMKV